MDAFTIDTPVDAIVTTYVPEPTVAELRAEIIALKSNLSSMTSNWEYASGQMRELRQKIENVKVHLSDVFEEEFFSEGNFIEVARLLDIELTKRVYFSVAVTYSGEAKIPLHMNEEDIQNEVSFSFDEGFSDIEWHLYEENVDWDIQEA